MANEIQDCRMTTFGSAVRPIITLALTGTFIFLIVVPFIPNMKTDHWGEVFAAFMGVFATIVGFWFGERSALKVPGGKS